MATAIITRGKRWSGDIVERKDIRPIWHRFEMSGYPWWHPLGAVAASDCRATTALRSTYSGLSNRLPPPGCPRGGGSTTGIWRCIKGSVNRLPLCCQNQVVLGNGVWQQSIQYKYQVHSSDHEWWVLCALGPFSILCLKSWLDWLPSVKWDSKRKQTRGGRMQWFISSNINSFSLHLTWPWLSCPLQL